jgi:arylsulfatase A-like enzyme
LTKKELEVALMRKRPNILLVVLDSVRPDHLSCYGYPRKTTPNIDSLADDALLFQNAFSAAPWTLPSHASIFTGMYPSQHGVLGRSMHLDKRIRTLAETLTLQGYETMGICTTPWVSEQTGLTRGFEKFISRLGYFHGFSSRMSLNWLSFCLTEDFKAITYNWAKQAKVFQKMREWILRSERLSRPFFIFVNHFDAHTPYDPPQPFRRQFEEIHSKDVRLRQIINVFNVRHGYPYAAKEMEVTKREWSVLRSWYDGEIAYMDFFLGKLFEFMKTRGIYDDTCITVTSDHGENFGEHHLANHIFCLYDTLIHVPLVIRHSEFASGGKRISDMVSHIDIFPTLLKVLGVELKDNPKPTGINLIASRNRTCHEHICAEYGPPVADIQGLKRLTPGIDKSLCAKFDRSLKCIRSSSFKYILASDGEEELFDLVKDPDESTNLVAGLPEQARLMRSLLSTAVGSQTSEAEQTTTKFDEDTKKRLQDLGYF